MTQIFHLDLAREALEASNATLRNPGQDPATKAPQATVLALQGIGHALIALAEKN